MVEPELTAPRRGLSILLADEDAGALHSPAEKLRSLGHEVATFAVGIAEAVRLIAEHDPDVTIVVVHRDLDHALRLMAEAGESARGPVVAQMNAPDAAVVATAAELGIAAVASEQSAEALQAAIEVAVRRHEETAALEARVDRLESALERRALIERAKGILMERHGVDDAAAFNLLRQHARNRSRSVVDVAQAIADGHALLPATRAGEG